MADEPEKDDKPVQALDAGDIALLKSYVRSPCVRVHAFALSRPTCPCSQLASVGDVPLPVAQLSACCYRLGRRAVHERHQAGRGRHQSCHEEN